MHFCWTPEKWIERGGLTSVQHPEPSGQSADSLGEEWLFIDETAEEMRGQTGKRLGAQWSVAGLESCSSLISDPAADPKLNERQRGKPTTQDKSGGRALLCFIVGCVGGGYVDKKRTVINSPSKLKSWQSLVYSVLTKTNQYFCKEHLCSLTIPSYTPHYTILYYRILHYSTI